MSNNPTNQFASLDFETKDDYVATFSNVRGRAQNLVQNISMHRSILALQFTYQIMQSVLTKNKPDGGDVLNPVLRICTVQSQTYIAWEGNYLCYNWL